MIAPAELAAQRAITAAFVASDAQFIVLTRNVRTPNGSGGYTNTKAAQPKQSLRLQPAQDGVGERTTADGRSVRPSYMLIGPHTASIQRFDEFTVGTRRYQVVFVQENQQYQVKAEVAYVGEL